MSSLPVSAPHLPVTIIGLQNSGKTTLLRWLVEGKFRRPAPTIGVEFETANIYGLHCTVFDVSGQEAFRENLWKRYVQSSVGLIYMFDSTDPKLIEESKSWYWKMVNEWMSGLGSDKCILFLANKADLKNSMKLDVIIDKLELEKMAQYPNITFQIFKVSIKTGKNLELAIKWLINKLIKLSSTLKFSPQAILVSDKTGEVIYQYMKKEIVKDSTFLSSFLSAISAFSDEILNTKNMIKVTKAANYYFLTLEHGELFITVSFENFEDLATARRVAHMIEAQIPTKGSYFPTEEINEFLRREIFRDNQ